MRIDWLPFSASALVTGATALAMGALLTPATETTAEALELADQGDGRWMLVAVLFFVASIALTLGLPAILTLFDERTAKLGLTAVAVFAVGCIGTAGYAMIIGFFRALLDFVELETGTLDQVTSHTGFGVFLWGWVGAFYLGELLIAVALLRARTTLAWVPLLLIAHVVSFPASRALPEEIASLTVLLATIGFAASGIEANRRHLVTTGH